MKTVRSLRKKLTIVFNKYVRLRDAKLPCISCGKFKDSYHAGHYYTKASTYANLRFSEINVNKQCVHCNTFLEGNKQGYREGLIKKYGPKVLDKLLVQNALKCPKWGVFEYEALIAQYTKKLANIA